MKFATEFRNIFTKQKSFGEKDWPVFSKRELLDLLNKQPANGDKIEFNVGGWLFLAVLNKKGNVKEILFMGKTPEAKIAEMGEYTDEETFCVSDAGSIVINGIAFRTGYGDGYNSIVIRTFTKRPVAHAAYCRAQIYNNAPFHYLIDGGALRIESYDCNKAGEGEACFEGPATGFVIQGRKVWVIIDHDKKAM